MILCGSSAKLGKIISVSHFIDRKYPPDARRVPDILGIQYKPDITETIETWNPLGIIFIFSLRDS
jgi:hypothetical protein